ncbi:MAG: NifB/NifX family molybdenum-iron cluster-binding protein [Desulfovibrionaceae bacterium]|nr:NifB/NifX family molybdenum-iron cluster-binding protein [Desulfovibrionaceae bacterium]
MQVVAISSEGPSLEDAVDPRFGRAGGFVLASYETDKAEPKISYLDNGQAQLLAQGAGIATTELLAKAQVNVVLSGYVGPKAFEALEAAGIEVVQDLDGQTVGEALDKFRSGACKVASAPNREAGR